MKTLFNFARSRSVSFFLALTMLFYAVSCNQFAIRSIAPKKLVVLEKTSSPPKHFIVHAGESLYEISNLSMEGDNLIGKLAPVTGSVYYSSMMKSTAIKNEGILNEIHLFLNTTIEPQYVGKVSLPFKDIKEVRLIHHDGSGTIALTVVSVVVLIKLFYLALSTITFCPLVYVHDGQKYEFAGEILGGAIGQNLCRNDYLPLPALQTQDGFYQLQVKNELEEKQYLDLMQLVSVQHPTGTRVLMDQSGQVHLLRDEQFPLRAQSFDEVDVRFTLQNKNCDAYSFNNEEASRNGVLLTFKKPQDAQTANLVLNVKNNLWADQVLNEYFSKFGNKFDIWMAEQAQFPSEDQIQSILKGDLPLRVYLKKEGQWQKIEELYPVGSLALKEVLVPLNLSGIDADEIELKLETGFMFWDLDYAAIDFTQASPSQLFITHIAPRSAIDTALQDQTMVLKAADQNYLLQKTVGEAITLRYPQGPTVEGMAQSLFLQSRGYYELIRKFKGTPRLDELKQFKTPGAFSDFSRKEYLKFISPLMVKWPY